MGFASKNMGIEFGAKYNNHVYHRAIATEATKGFAARFIQNLNNTKYFSSGAKRRRLQEER